MYGIISFMCNGRIHVPYVAVKNNEYKAMLKIVMNVLNSLQVFTTEKYRTCIFFKEKRDEN